MSQGSDAEEREWRFSLDEVGPEAQTDPDPPEPDPIEPEPISLEHAVFVGLGVVLTLGFMMALVRILFA